MTNLDALADYAAPDARPVTASETLATRWALPRALRAPGGRAWRCSTSPGAAASRRRRRSRPWPRPTICRSHRTIAPGRSCSPLRCISRSTRPNALVQEVVRAFYTDWYRELVTALPPLDRGFITAPPGPVSASTFYPTWFAVPTPPSGPAGCRALARSLTARVGPSYHAWGAARPHAVHPKGEHDHAADPESHRRRPRGGVPRRRRCSPSSRPASRTSRCSRPGRRA